MDHKVQYKKFKEYQDAYRLRNREKRATSARLSARANPGYYRESNWKRQGINLKWEEFLAMLQKQSAMCAICENEIGTNAHVDHDHNTGSIRGLLCGLCNKGLGLFKEEPYLLMSAAKYLEKVKR